MKAKISIQHLKSKTNPHGEHPIYFTIRYNSKPARIASGIYITPDYWNKSKRRIVDTHPNVIELNKSLDIGVNKLLSIVNDLNQKNTSYSVTDIVNRFKYNEHSQSFTFISLVLR